MLRLPFPKGLALNRRVCDIWVNLVGPSFVRPACPTAQCATQTAPWYPTGYEPGLSFGCDDSP